MLGRTPSPERHEYLIQPTALTAESREVLLYFLKHFAHQGVRKFDKVSYSFSLQESASSTKPAVLKAYTQIRLENPILIRRLGAPTESETFPENFAIDIYSGKKLELKLGATCLLDEVVGTLEYSQNTYKFIPRKFYALDPMALSDGSQILLEKILQKDFLTDPRTEKFISPSDLISFQSLDLQVEEAPEDFDIQICQTLMRKPCSKTPLSDTASHTPLQHTDVHYFIYSSEHIGVGAFSVVSAITGKLIVQPSGKLLFKQYEEKKQWVGKLQSTDKEKSREFVKHEYKLTHLASEPRVKPPIFINSTSVLMMRMVSGQTLHALLEYERKSSLNQEAQKLSLDLCLKMIVQALRKYLKQIQANSIISGDIKSTNLKFTDEGLPVFLDFGLGGVVEDKKPPSGGTYRYASPESFTRAPLTAKSDVFSFAWMIFDILGGEKPELKGENGDIEKPAERIAKSIYEQFPERISKSSLLMEASVEHRKRILQIVRNMFSANPDHRPRFDEILKEFEIVIFERTYPVVTRDISHAHEKGIELRKELYKFSQKNKIAPETLDKLLKTVKATIDSVVDERSALAEFIEMADLLFLTVKSKAEMFADIRAIVENFKDHYGYLVRFQAEVETTLKASDITVSKKESLNKLKYVISKLMNELEQKPTLEAIIMLNKKLEKNLLFIKTTLDSFQSGPYVNTPVYTHGVFTRMTTTINLNTEDEYLSAQSDSSGSHMHAPFSKVVTRKNESRVNLTAAGLLFGRKSPSGSETTQVSDFSKLYNSHYEREAERPEKSDPKYVVVNQAP